MPRGISTISYLYLEKLGGKVSERAVTSYFRYCSK